MRTNINQGRIQSLAVMIVMLINNDQTPYLTYYRILGLTVHATSTHCFQLPSPRSPENLSVMKSSRYPVLLESFWQSHSGVRYPLLLLAVKNYRSARRWKCAGRLSIRALLVWIWGVIFSSLTIRWR